MPLEPVPSSAHSACNFHLLAFSDQRSQRCALQDASRSAWMNSIGQDPTSSKGWVEEVWVLFSVSLTLPDSLLWYHPRPNWSYLPSALRSAYLSKTHLLSKQLSVAISHWEARGPQGLRAPSRTGQKASWSSHACDLVIKIDCSERTRFISHCLLSASKELDPFKCMLTYMASSHRKASTSG